MNVIKTRSFSGAIRALSLFGVFGLYLLSCLIFGKQIGTMIGAIAVLLSAFCSESDEFKVELFLMAVLFLIIICIV